MTTWSKGFIEHENGDGSVYLSIPFTWNLPEAYQRAVWLGSPCRSASRNRAACGVCLTCSISERGDKND